VQRFTSYQQCTRFRTTRVFDREYLWNGSNNREAENSVLSTTILSTFDKNILVNFGLLTKNDVDLWPMTLKFNRVHADVKVHAKYHRVSRAAHQLSCTQALLPYLAMVKNQKIRTCDVDFWAIKLKFSALRAVVKIHAGEKNLKKAECSGSWVIMVRERENLGRKQLEVHW